MSVLYPTVVYLEQLIILQIDNFTPTSSSLPIIASHIAIHLKTPDLLFIQEIQDNSGSKDDGTVNANVTLSNIVAAIANASGGIQYDFVQIDPVDKQDGTYCMYPTHSSTANTVTCRGTTRREYSPSLPVSSADT